MRSGFLFFIYLIPVILLGSCSRNENRFVVLGAIENLPEQHVILEELGIHEITRIDSVRSKEDGSFELRGVAPEPGIYRLSFEGNQYIVLSISKGATLKIKGDWNRLYDYEVTGSPESQNMKDFLRVVRESARDINTVSEVIRQMQEQGNDSLLTSAYQDMKDINFQLTRFIEQYADTVSYLPNAIFAVQILNPVAERDYLEAFTQSLERRFSNSRLSQDFTVKFQRMIAQHETRMKPRFPDNASDPRAPDFILPTPEGMQVSLSSFKGKYVLVDFWASWCAPCRKENPNVVAAYNRFKDKNFTILGVSLDQKREAWEKAIRDDGLEWTNVSDLRGWSSVAAQMYQVESIPANFLIDPDGKIIASNLRGPALAAHLQQILQ